MKADVAASLIVTVVGGVALSMVDSGWLVGEWSANPTKMGSYTVLALVLGAGIHGLMLGLFGEERRKEKARRREEKERRAVAGRKQAAKRAQAAAAAERLRGRIESLDAERMALLATAYTYGVVERGYDTRDAVLLKGISKLGLVSRDGVGVLTGTWKLTPACRAVMEKMKRGESVDAPN